jgi:hypothetical protein
VNTPLTWHTSNSVEKAEDKNGFVYEYKTVGIERFDLYVTYPNNGGTSCPISRLTIEGCKEEAQLLADAITTAIEKARAEAITVGSQPKEDARVLTCVYCGHEYPQGTPAAGSQILTDHIKSCEKHPMAKLRKALVGLIDCDGKGELEQMEATLRLMPGIEKDKIAAINGIHALLETLPPPPQPLNERMK